MKKELYSIFAVIAAFAFTGIAFAAEPLPQPPDTPPSVQGASPTEPEMKNEDQVNPGKDKHDVEPAEPAPTPRPDTPDANKTVPPCPPADK